LYGRYWELTSLHFFEQAERRGVHYEKRETWKIAKNSRSSFKAHCRYIGTHSAAFERVCLHRYPNLSNYFLVIYWIYPNRTRSSAGMLRLPLWLSSRVVGSTLLRTDTISLLHYERRSEDYMDCLNFRLYFLFSISIHCRAWNCKVEITICFFGVLIVKQLF